jgi:hypothetical protein
MDKLNKTLTSQKYEICRDCKRSLKVNDNIYILPDNKKCVTCIKSDIEKGMSNFELICIK